MKLDESLSREVVRGVTSQIICSRDFVIATIVIYLLVFLLLFFMFFP